MLRKFKNSRDVSSGSTQRGGGLIEYALLFALISITTIVAIQVLGGQTGGSLDNSATEISVGFDSAGIR